MLELKRRGKKGTWQIKGSINGKRYRESTGTDSRTHAEAILAKRQAEILDRSVWGEARTSTFAEAVVYYLEKGGEARFLEPLLSRWGDKRIADIAESDVSRAAHQLYPGRTAAWHVRAVYTPLNAVIRRAHRGGMCELRVFDKPAVKSKPVSYAKDDWFQVVLPKCGFRLASMILFLTLTGARVQEACDVLPADVDLERAEATLRHTKNGTERVVKLAPILVDAMSKLIDMAKDEAEKAKERGESVTPRRLFGYASRWSVNQAIERACKRAGAQYLSSHKIGRHAFAARLLREGHSLRVVQEAGGWKVARMVTDHYGHLERSQIEAAVSGVGTHWSQGAGTFTRNLAKPRKSLGNMVGATGIEPVTPTMSRSAITRKKPRKQGG